MNGLVWVRGRELDVQVILSREDGIILVDENPVESRSASMWEKVRENLHGVAGLRPGKAAGRDNGRSMGSMREQAGD